MSNFDYLNDLVEKPGSRNFVDSVFNLLSVNQDVDYLSKVYVLGETALITHENRKLVQSTLNEFVYWSPSTLNNFWFQDKSLLDRVVAERINYLDGIKSMFFKFVNTDQKKEFSDDFTYIYIAHAFGWYAYGHLHDSLQRLYNVKELLVKGKVKIVVSNFNRVVDFKIHLSALLGFEVDDSDLIVLERGKLYSFKNLVVPYYPAIATTYTKDTYAWVVRGYLTKFIDQSDDTALNGIYLSRNHVSPGRRSALNEQEIVDYLITKGFKVLYGTESLSEIVNSFYRAKVVIGPHGSFFANTIYCQDHCKIYEFCADNRKEFSQRNKFKAAKLYDQQMCPADSEFNIEIPLQRIKDILEA
jgi:hypothetical protein